MWFLYFAIALLSICYLLYYYVTRTFNYWKIRNVAGPKPVPLFGSLLESGLRKKHIAEVFKDIYDAFPDEKIVGMYRMTTPCLMVRDLDIVKQIFIKDFEYFSDRGVSYSEEGLGVNLFHADNEMWRALRNRFTPIFTAGKLKNMVHLMVDCADKLTNYVESFSSAQYEHDVQKLMQKYTMAAISSCVFGMEFDTMSDKKDVFAKFDKLIFTPSFMDEADMMFPGILRKIKLEPFPQEIVDFFENLVRTVMEQRNNVPSNRKDFIDAILELKQEREIQIVNKFEEKETSVELTNGMIAAQAFIFYAAGYETSAATMSFLLYELAKSPDVQDKLINEVDEVFKKHDGKITYEALMELTYMEKCIEETLRLYPVGEPLQRKTQQDYTIPGTDVVLKKGQIVIISALGIQRDEKHYPNPEKFDPERFNAENASGRHSCAFLPFGTGPRNCIGMRLSKIQARACLLRFFSKFRVEPSKNTSMTMKFIPRRFVIGPVGGIPLNIVPRKK